MGLREQEHDVWFRARKVDGPSTLRPHSSSFWGALEFFKVIPKRNYYGAYGYKQPTSRMVFWGMLWANM